MLLCDGDIHAKPGPGSTSSTHSCISENVFAEINAHNYFSFIHLNVQSIQHKLDTIYAELCDFDVLAFSETWLNSSISSEDLILHSFHKPERKDRIGDSHGGVIVYIKDILHYKRRPDLEINRLECIWIELTIGSKHLLFGVFYRPPSSDTIYNNLIEDSIGLATDTNISDIIITDDFNFNALHPVSLRKIESLAQQFNLVQLINEPTHFTEHSESITDLIFVSNKHNILKFGVGEHFLDQDQRYHVPVYVFIKFYKSNQDCFERLIWQYDQGNYDNLRSEMRSYNWQYCFDDDINIYSNNITSKIIDFAKNNIPNKVVKIRPSDAPWMNNNIKKNIRIRKRLYKKAKRTQSQYYWHKFKKARNETILLIREAKSDYFSKLSKKLKSGYLSSKDWWKTLKSFISKEKNNRIPPLQKSTTHQITNSDFEKANLLNAYFQSQTTLDDGNKDAPYLGPPITEMFLSNIVLTVAEINEVLKSLPVDKAARPDGISNRILKEACNELASPLCNLFNASLQCCTVPSSWKEAYVTPVYKKGDASLPNNYRPISL